MPSRRFRPKGRKRLSTSAQAKNIIDTAGHFITGSGQGSR
jgi:hypothetical protein